MEFSVVFGFLTILNESIKLLRKNVKFMASITILSLLLPSILLLLFCYSYQSLINHMTNSIMKYSGPDSGIYQQIILYLVLLFLVEIASVIALLLISHISAIATIFVSSMSYADKKISLQDLFSRIKTTWRRQLTNTFRRSNNPTRYASVALMLVVSLAIFYRNPITISIAIVLGITVSVFQLYASVVWVLSHVVLIVEDVSDGTEALEKAEHLVKGQRHHGFMINLLFNSVFLIIFLGCWMILGDKGSLNLTVYGLFFVNSLSLGRIYLSITYTVLYFQCKKYHGEEIDLVLGNFEYTKLPATKLGNDIP